MKLLRLTTEDSEGRFDNFLNDDLIIPEDGTIQLYNLTASIRTSAFIINGTNLEVDVQTIGSEGFKTIYLNQGIYTRNNYTDLLNDMTLKFNKVVSYNSSDIGRQWKCFLDAGKVKCETRSKILSPTPNSTNFYSLNTGYTKSQGIWERTTGGGGGSDAFIGYNISQSLGSCSLRTRVYAMAPSTAPALSGFMIGFYKLPITSAITSIEIQNVAYGILAPRKGANYICIRNGVQETLNPNVPIFDGDLTGARTDNDFLDIQLANGVCTMNVYKQGDVKTLLNLFSYDHTTPVYAFITYYGQGTNNGTRTSKTEFTPNPYEVDSVQYLDEDDEELIGVSPPKIGVNIKSSGAINWRTFDLAKFLGFENQIISQSNVVNYNYTGQNPFKPGDLVENFLVLLENIQLESYDTLTNNRLNIVHSIVSPNIKEDKIEYTASYPVKLQLKNKNPLTIRNIRARLVGEDLEPVRTIGFSSMTLLIE
jgi:hypothetical protein